MTGVQTCALPICGGDPKICDDYSLFEIAPEIMQYHAKKTGYISKILADEIGKVAMMLGAGRSKKDDIIDHSVGLIMKVKVGDYVKKDDILLEIYHKNNLTKNIIDIVENAIEYSEIKIEKKPIIFAIIEGE